MIESAQDAEMILDNEEDCGQGGVSKRIEGLECEDTFPESPWKGCVSDNDEDVKPPSTLHCDVKVVIYTPSRTWIPVDAPAATPPSPPFGGLVLEASDDNASVLGMNHDSSVDWGDHSDALDEAQATQEITRRVSTVSPIHQTAPPVEARDLGPVTPKNETASSNSTSTSGKKTISQQRDSRGRFTSSSLVRDAQGRSVPKNGTSATVKRRASLGSSTMEKAPQSLERDSKLPPKETPIPPPQPLSRRLASTSVIADEERPVITRDAKRKFAKKQTPVPPSQTLKSAGRSADPSLAAAVDGSGGPEPKSVSKLSKAKKAPAKSPYFAPGTPPTPPISPEITRKNKTQKGDRADAPGEPKTSQKNNAESPASQGSGKKCAPGKTLSCIPFPPLLAPHFGLIQEKLAHDPFRLLIAVTFLIRTYGKHAIPVFFELMEKYPTPETLVAADKEEIVRIIRHLGLQNQRASTYQMYAKIWLEDPPAKDKRYAVRGYPNPESGRDVKKGEILSDEDNRHAWEIGHMTQGPYAIDSWRIFCRDKLRGEAAGWNGEGREEGFQPEWMRVVPEDKELRAYLRWMWLKEGFEWDPFTGDKEVARPELMRAAMEGRIAWDDQGGMRILDEVMVPSPTKSDSSQVSTPRVRDSQESEEELA